MRRIVSWFLFLLLLGSSTGVSAQNVKIDSLKSLLPIVTGVERFDLLRMLAAEYFYIDENISLQYIDEAINSIPQIQDSLRIVKAYRNKGQVLYELGRLEDIVFPLVKGLGIARRNRFTAEILQIINMMGLVYVHTGEYGKALDFFLEPLTWNEPRETSDFSILYNSLGLVYYKLRNNEKALDYYEKSLLERQKDNRLKNIGTLYINIGLCYCELSDYRKALYYINKGLSECNNGCDWIVIPGQFALGMTKFRMNNLMESEFHLENSLLVSRSNNDKRFVAENLLYLARVYLETGRYQRAGQALKESEAIALEDDYKELLLDTYRVFIELFKKENHSRNLSEYYFKYGRLREKLYGQELLQSIAAFQVDLKHHESVETLSHQKQVMALQRDALAWEKLLYYGLGCIIVLLGIILLLVYKQILDKGRIRQELERRIIERTAILQEQGASRTKVQQDMKEVIRLTLDTIYNGLRRMEEIDTESLVMNNDAAIIEYVRGVQSAMERVKILAKVMDKATDEASLIDQPVFV